MKLSKFFIMACVAISSFAPLCGDYVDEQIEIEKIYVSPDQIVLTNEGVFLFTETGIIPVNFLSSDTCGLYVVAGYYQCPACGRYNKNNICSNPSCPMFGR